MAQQLALSVDFGSGFTQAWSKIAKVIPQFIAFLAILVIGWFVAKAIARLLDRVLRRVGSERVAARSGVAARLAGSKYDMTGIICKVVYYIVLLMALQLAFGVFGPNPISVMIHSIVAWLPRAIVAVVIMVVAMAIANGARDIVGNSLSGASYGRTVSTLVWAFIVGLGAIAALGQAGIATAITGPVLIAALATIAGVLVVGVGGGLIMPMRQRWERWLDSAEQETARLRGSAYQAGRTDALANQPIRPTTQTGPGAPPAPGIDPGESR
ncbi:putative transporter (transmembrane protein) [Streptomyces sp. 1114.5]|uniref:mechanosensitive ion channel family protein n=1 Tax=unclassified Streptomyces TaxID=2593676 RepID=UPI000BCC719E|nr:MULTISPECIES: hypothetical protein [unclassified Streptomyces]RKT12316.1 putative transporter (transmembrane protein) [Streptomyces sp. 1114.5]SOB79455.1 Conserved TM helix [Streptomyces sp. 1331.2]